MALPVASSALGYLRVAASSSAHGAYITKLIEVGAELGPSEYTKEKERALSKKKTNAFYNSLLNDFQQTATIAAVKSLPSDKLAALALKFFETLPNDKQLKAGSFNHRSGKFALATINAEFKPWLNKTVAPEFNLEAFEAYVRERGHDPDELRAHLRSVVYLFIGFQFIYLYI